MIEVNPRASRTVPFVSKSIGVPLASYASRCMLGETLEEIGFTEEVHVPYVSVKEAVFPFVKLQKHPRLGNVSAQAPCRSTRLAAFSRASM